MLPLIGKRALVCGSSQGIGRACAAALAELGASVVLLARNGERLAAAAAALPIADGARHGWVAADFTEPERVALAVEEQLAEAGPVQILVNNTGGPPGGPIFEALPEEFLTAFRAHVLANQLLVHAVVPGMRESGYGRIINIISTSVKQPIPRIGVSNTIRGAVASWAKTLAGELGPHGITVNNVLPGATRTARLESLIAAKAERTGRAIGEIEQAMREEIPLGRFAEPEEIAAAVAWLATPAAGYVHGINLPVDGGRLGCL